MKKILALAAVISALTLSLTACSGGTSSDSSENSSTSGASSNEPMTSEAHESEATGGEDSAPSDVATGETGADDESGAQTGERTAASLAEAVKSVLEFPAMDEVEECDFDVTDIEVEDSYYYTNVMSPHLYRIVIVKPSEATEEICAQRIEDYANYMKTEAALYADQEVSAAGTVSGVTDDGFYYVIVHQDGAKGEEALLEA